MYFRNVGPCNLQKIDLLTLLKLIQHVMFLILHLFILLNMCVNRTFYEHNYT